MPRSTASARAAGGRVGVRAVVGAEVGAERGAAGRQKASWAAGTCSPGRLCMRRPARERAARPPSAWGARPAAAVEVDAEQRVVPARDGGVAVVVAAAVGAEGDAAPDAVGVPPARPGEILGSEDRPPYAHQLHVLLRQRRRRRR